MLTAAVIAVSLAVVTPSPARAQPGGCADVAYLGARASGERWDTFGGLGPTVDHVRAVLAARLRTAGLTLAAHAVAYPAEPTRDLYEPWRGRFRTYFQSIAAGVRGAVALARSVARACPQSRLVLAGYSQGAMATHQAVRRLVVDLGSRIAAVILVGDGDRHPGTRAVRFGTAPPSARGIRSALLPWTRGDVALPARTADVCTAGDLICDFAAARFGGLRALRRAIAAHRAYADPLPGGGYAFSALLDRAARWAARLAIASTVPARGPTAVLAGVGASFAGWRAATGQRVDAAPRLPDRLESNRCVVLLLPQEVSPAETAALRAYLRAGGTVVGLGERGDGARFTAADRALSELAHSLDAHLMLTGDARDPGSTITKLVAPDLAAWRIAGLGYDWASEVRAGPGTRVLARSADGAAALLAEQRLGSGRLVLSGDSDLFTGGPGDAFAAGDNSRLVARLCP